MKILTIIRSLRLLRLLRMIRSNAFKLTVAVFSKALRPVAVWLITFGALVILIITIIAAFQYVSEVGERTLAGDCERLNNGSLCETCFSDSSTCAAIFDTSCAELGVSNCFVKNSEFDC